MIEPNGCMYCGIGQYEHGTRWSQLAKEANHQESYTAGWGRTLFNIGGSHTWVQPSQDQIKERMLKRRLERNGR